MNHGNSQNSQNHDNSLYGFGSQDDFSTPFSHDGAGQQPGFADPGSFMASTFNSHFDQQMNTEPHETLGSDLYQHNGPPSWQPQYFDASHMGGFQSLGESAQAQTFGSTFNTSQLNAYNDLHEPSSFPNFAGQSSFEEPPRQQSSMGTINPHAIQTPSDFVYQPPATPQAHAQSITIEPKQEQSAELSSLPHIQAAEPAPKREFFDTDLTQAIDAATPKFDKQGWISSRRQSQFQAGAKVEALRGLPFLVISANAYDSAEARVVQPPRRQFLSINELESRLKALPPGKHDAKVKSLLESKVAKVKTQKKGKAPKARRIATTSGSTSAGAAKPTTTILEEDSEDESSSSASDDESDYASDTDEFVEEEPSPLPPSRPEDPIKAQEYDIVKTVWAREAVRIGPDDVKRRLAAYLEIAKKIRAEWRAAVQSGVAAKKREFEDMLRLTVKHGHHNFIESVDQLTPLAVVMSVGVTEALKANTYADSLLEVILELVVKIPNIDPNFLKATKLDKYKDKIIKKAEGRVKSLATFIDPSPDTQASTQEASKSTVSMNGQAAATGSGPMARTNSSQSQSAKKATEQGSVAIRKLPTSAVELKKPPDGTTGPRKPIAAGPGKPATLAQSTAGLQNKVAASLRPGALKSGDKAATASQNGNAVKTTIRQVVPAKTTSIFSSLQSASKKPGTGMTATARPPPPKAATPVQKPPPPPAPSRPAYSFASTLANIGRPKEEPKKTETIEQRAPETEEERKKRLRKEERRKLRVTWKPDSDLCAIRIFDHRQDDETEHEEREVADAADLKSEGQAFKRQLMRDNVSGVEPEDDEEQDLIEWYDPKVTDFASVYERRPGDQDPPPQNVETRANGPVKFNSEESDTQRKREQGVMIEMYQSIRDVPSCPKEPADPFNGKVLAIQDEFGPIKNCGTNPHIAARLEDRNQQLLRQYNYRANVVPEPATQPAADISSLLAMLSQSSTPVQPQYQPQQQQQQYPPQAANPYSALLSQFSSLQQQPPAAAQASNPYQDAINLFNSMQAASQVPAAPMPSTPQPPTPQQPAVASSDLSSILASLAGSVPQPAPQSQAPVAQVQPQPQSQPEAAPPGIDPSILGWLAQYNSSNASTSQAPTLQSAAPTPTNWQNYGGTSGAGQAASPSDWLRQLNAAGANGSGNDRKRGYEDDGRNDAGGSKKKKKAYAGRPVVPCKFYKEGTCHKGSECTYIHD